MIVLLPVLAAVVGCIMWIVAANPTWKYLGLVTYGAGLLAFLMTGGQQVIELLGR
jgi:hypothetical protein